MRSVLRPALCLVVALVASVVARVPRAVAHDDALPELRWSEGYTLVVLEPGTDLGAATRLVQARGGTVALQLPPRFLAGWIPPDLDAALVGHAGIRSIHHDASHLPAGPAGDRQSNMILRFFARAARGDLEFSAMAAADPAAGAVTKAADESAGTALATHRSASGDLVPGADFKNGPGVLLPDAFDRPPVSPLDILANLERQGITPVRKAGNDFLTANSETMTGTTSVALFFVESDGTGADANVYDWTADAEQDVYAQAAAALSWWSGQAKKHSDCWAVFRLEPHFATQDGRCAQWREPLLHPSTDYASAVSEVLGNFGYTAGGAQARCIAYNAALRTVNNTDWAYSAFVAANPTGPTAYSDGYAAWAYLGGPYAALLQHSFGWSFKQVFAHESAHAFRACDEYSVAGYGGCSSCAGCIDTGASNGNCEVCTANPVSCMMRSNAFSLCSYTISQLGWDRAPCVPQSLPAPQLDTVLPAAVPPGADIDVDLKGAFLVNGDEVDFGPDIAVTAVNVISASLLRVHLHVGLEASLGLRDVTVTGPNNAADVLNAAFRVVATPRHYVSSGGAAQFPYDRPDRAAHDLATVLGAASIGDTILVTSGTYAPFTIDKSLTVIASRAADFTSPSDPAFPSIVQGTNGGPAIQIVGTATHVLLDGLVVRGGSGTLFTVPELGAVVAGGGIMCFDATATLRNCTIEGNQTGTDAAPGAGGGAFCWRAQVRFEHCTVRNNRASRGAGILGISANLTLIDTAVENNDAGGAGTGAGCSILGGSLVARGGHWTGNVGALDGGGAHFENCAAATVSNLEVSGNRATRDGGGIHAAGTPLVLEGLRVTGNTAGRDGAGVATSGAALRIESSVLAANDAAHLGGGVHASSGDLTIVNATIAGNAGGPASGVYVRAAGGAVQIRASVLAGNVLGALFVDGATPVALDWNLVWQNGAFDWIGAASGPNDVALDPLFVNAVALDYRVALASPALDSGDPDPARNDLDGSRNDRGAEGGPRASLPAPARVASLVARDFGSHVWVQWAPSSTHDIVTYALYRDVSPGLDLTVLPPLALVPASNPSFDDSAPAAGGATYAVVAMDAAGHASGSTRTTATPRTTDASLAPLTFALHPIAPNPVNPGAWVAFDLPAPTAVRITIYDAHGHRLRTLLSGTSAAGSHRIYWNGENDHAQSVASGLYWVVLDAVHERRTRKITVVR